MKSFKYLVFPFAFILIIVSCEKIKTMSDVPHIGFISFTVYDTSDILGNTIKGGTLKFNFEDGDGDLGLDAPKDSLSDSINLFLTLYRMKNGVLIPVPVGDPFRPTGFRIPYIDRPGHNKILKGTIAVDFSYLFYSAADSLKYDFYVKDRAGNVSNVDSTTVIPISIDGVYKR